MANPAKNILVSGIQPTGRLHIGNYLGMLQNAVALQNSGKYHCYYMVVDLHSLTEPFEPAVKQKQILEIAAEYIAAGLNPKKCVFFQQSQVPAHSELAWILNTLTPMGELERMTQFKDKAKIDYQFIEGLAVELRRIQTEFDRSEDPTYVKSVVTELIHQTSGFVAGLNRATESRGSANVGLFDYPVLMAADILLYDAKYVPVGDDQLQHLELTRTLARKFNGRFGKTFVEPQPILTQASRVMSLKDPNRKMSKSEPDGCLFLEDSPADIERKVKRAVTDSGSEIVYREDKPGIVNLLDIYAALSGATIPALEKKYAGQNYGALKADLIDLYAKHFAEFRKKKKALLAKPKGLATILAAGSRAAAKVATPKLLSVKNKLGLAL